MTKFCCDDLKWACSKYVMYESSQRSYSVYEKGSSRYGVCIDYCPFCGSKLPKNLIDERWDIILKELGKEYLPDDDGNLPKKELPEEFKTDEWWKKRRL
ncbi:MAG: hypothetical protein IJA14_03330 [Alphaproteobacteria bacterium]|nr:hypothetical protein [Alphaproteobacteria bacterium]